MLLVIAPQRLARFLTILVVTIGVIGTGAEFVQQASRSWSYGRVSTVAGKFVLDSELTVSRLVFVRRDPRMFGPVGAHRAGETENAIAVRAALGRAGRDSFAHVDRRNDRRA